MSAENVLQSLVNAAFQNFRIEFHNLDRVTEQSQRWRSTLDQPRGMCQSEAMIDHIANFGGYQPDQTQTLVAVQDGNEVGVLMIAPRFSWDARSASLGVQSLTLEYNPGDVPVMEIVALCARNSAGVGQLLMLLAICLAKGDAILLQLHRTFREFTMSDFNMDMGIQSSPEYSVAAQHILGKYHFEAIRTTDGVNELNVAFFFRPGGFNPDHFQLDVDNWVTVHTRRRADYLHADSFLSQPQEGMDPHMQMMSSMDMPQSSISEIAADQSNFNSDVFLIENIPQFEPMLSNVDFMPFSIGGDSVINATDEKEMPLPTLAVHRPHLIDLPHISRQLLKPGRKPMNKVCPICLKTFTRSTNMRRHIREHEQANIADRTFGCGQCTDRFARKQDLEAHVTRVHSAVRAFPCPSCDYRAKTKSDLRAHERRRHPH